MKKLLILLAILGIVGVGAAAFMKKSGGAAH